jgi:hypothetical protein
MPANQCGISPRARPNFIRVQITPVTQGYSKPGFEITHFDRGIFTLTNSTFPQGFSRIFKEIFIIPFRIMPTTPRMTALLNIQGSLRIKSRGGYPKKR